MNEKRLRVRRLQRLREQLVAADYAAGVFFDPVNVRYATDSRNMQIWTLRNPARYVFVATDGPVVMFELQGCEHLVTHLETIDEVRPATSWFYFTAGPQMMDRAEKWAAEIACLVAAHGGGSVVTVERTDGTRHIPTADPVAVLTEQITAGDVRSLHVERPDLETVFLNLTGRRLRD